MERRVPEAPLTRAEKCIEERAGTFRARCKKSGRTYRGPTRTLRAEALEDAHKLVAAADTSSQELEAIVAQLHSKLPQAKLTQAEQCIEERGGTFRVRFKKGGRTHIGPTRTSKDEALEDAKSLVAAADISMAELQQRRPGCGRRLGHKKLIWKRPCSKPCHIGWSKAIRQVSKVLPVH